MSDVQDDAPPALIDEEVEEIPEVEVEESAEDGEVAEVVEESPLETQEDFCDGEASTALTEPIQNLQPVSMPTITTFKTLFAPSKLRLDAMLNTVQANSIPVLPASSEYLEYPRPKEDLESSSETTLGEQLTYAGNSNAII